MSVVQKYLYYINVLMYYCSSKTNFKTYIIHIFVWKGRGFRSETSIMRKSRPL